MVIRQSKWTLTLVLLAAVAAPALAGSGEQRVALRHAATAAAEQLASQLGTAPKVAEHAIARVLIVVGPRGAYDRSVHEPLSNALVGLEGFSEVWPQEDITAFVDRLFLHPQEPRYDPDTVLALGGTFQAADGLLLVRYGVEEGVKGGTRASLDMELWHAKKALKLWGTTHAETFDLSALAELNALIDAGRIDEALVEADEALAKAPEWKAEIALARARAEKLQANARELALIRGNLDLNEIDQAFAGLKKLYAAGDPALREALWGLLTDVRAKLIAPLTAQVENGDMEAAKAGIQRIETTYAEDLDLATALAVLKGRVRELEAEKARAEAAARSASAEEGARSEGDAQNRQILYYVVGGVVGLLLLGFLLSLALRKRSTVGRRNLGIETLESEAEQAERVKEVLDKDRDLRRSMLRELDRAEDALAEAHVKAQDGGRGDVARRVHAATQHLQELRRRVKLVVDGDAQDFLKGRLPKRNLEGLVTYVPAVAGQMHELTREAVATQDSVAAGGDPTKNLELLGGIAIRLQGKLAERESFFRKMS